MFYMSYFGFIIYDMNAQQRANVISLDKNVIRWMLRC